MQITHSRSRAAATVGLFLQLAAFGVVLWLSYYTRSKATLTLAWHLLGGAAIWFATLLVCRQRELAQLEEVDLEQLRREKAAGGGAETIFDEDSGAFRVAASRLEWMQKWLVPTFGLIAGLVLVGLGGVMLWSLRGLPLGASPETLQKWVSAGQKTPFLHDHIAMIVLAVVALCTFLFSRYASGMGRVREWQLLRGCGSYMLGNAVVAALLIVAFGVNLYMTQPMVEHVLAKAIPVLMVLLGVESLLNFVLDIYRPRKPGVEPRAAFDSRLLGLFAEPGGIAHSIAEAVNYQFGFEVSQTWFYQLIQRTAIPLVLFGALVLWGMTSIVVVQPDQHVIIERWGGQLNAEAPYGPGIYVKYPWPVDVARVYETGRVKQIYLGFKEFAGEPDFRQIDRRLAMGQPIVVQWTDPQHLGLDHFDFLAPLPAGSYEPSDARGAEARVGVERETSKAAPVHSIRMHIVAQYRISAERLTEYTQNTSDPEELLRRIAWEEAQRFIAAHDVPTLLGSMRDETGVLLDISEDLRRDIAAAANDSKLGIDVVYVGLQNVHPEKSVSEAYRKVVNAEQEKFSQIRAARVEENKLLSSVVGDKELARRMARAINIRRDQSDVLDRLEGAQLDVDPLLTAHAERLSQLKPLVENVQRALLAMTLSKENLTEAQREYEIGMRHTKGQLASIAERHAAVERRLEEAEAALAAGLAPLREELGSELDEATVDALVTTATGRMAVVYWDAELTADLASLRGDAAQILAQGRAARWGEELGAAGQMARVKTEIDAYRAAPRIYKARLRLSTLVERVRNARKFFFGFDPNGRTVHIRYDTGAAGADSLMSADLQPTN